jgi:PLP dependent protein
MAISTAMISVRENFLNTQAAISTAAKNAERRPGEVRLVAVSKTYDANHIRPVLDAGHRVFGENRVQEAQAKWPPLRAAYPGLELHLIGPLQSNKAADAVALFDVIETVDRPKIAEALAKELKRQSRVLRFYVQVNTGREPQKAGVWPEQLDAMLLTCRSLGLPVEGLMCIPPVEELPAKHFALLKSLAIEHGLTSLSMGMSSDFAEAIANGATHVRVGSAIFGSRTYNTP